MLYYTLAQSSFFLTGYLTSITGATVRVDNDLEEDVGVCISGIEDRTPGAIVFRPGV